MPNIKPNEIYFVSQKRNEKRTRMKTQSVENQNNKRTNKILGTCTTPSSGGATTATEKLIAKVA